MLTCRRFLAGWSGGDRTVGTPGGALSTYAERQTDPPTSVSSPVTTTASLSITRAHAFVWCSHSVRHRASMEPDFDVLMAHLHITPLLATSALMACHPPPALARHARALPAQLALLAAHSAAYIGWSRVCVAMNGGHWPYPFQAGLGVWGHAALDGGGACLSGAVSCLVFSSVVAGRVPASVCVDLYFVFPHVGYFLEWGAREKRHERLSQALWPLAVRFFPDGTLGERRWR